MDQSIVSTRRPPTSGWHRGPALLCALAACAIALPASAETHYRSDCRVVETTRMAHFGRKGEAAELSMFTCRIRGGPLHGFVVNGTNLWEIGGKSPNMLLGSMAVAQGPGASVVYEVYDVKRRPRRGNDDVKGWESTSWGVYKSASGAVAFLAGKTFTSVVRSTGTGTFSIDNTVNE